QKSRCTKPCRDSIAVWRAHLLRPLPQLQQARGFQRTDRHGSGRPRTKPAPVPVQLRKKQTSDLLAVDEPSRNNTDRVLDRLIEYRLRYAGRNEKNIV